MCIYVCMLVRLSLTVMSFFSVPEWPRTAAVLAPLMQLVTLPVWKAALLATHTERERDKREEMTSTSLFASNS